MNKKAATQYDDIFARGATQGLTAGIIFSAGVGITVFGWFIVGLLVALFGALIYLETKLDF